MLRTKLSGKNIKNIHGPISFHYMKKGDKKIYLFGDKHYKYPEFCHSSQNIVPLLNEIRENHNLFIEGECREPEDVDLTNYICEVIKNVKQTSTRKIFYSDKRYTHLSFIMRLRAMLVCIIDNNVKGFMITNYYVEEELEKIKDCLENYDKGLQMTEVNLLLNKLKDEKIKEEYPQAYSILYQYGKDLLSRIDIEKFNFIIKNSRVAFKKILKNNKRKNETVNNFIESLNTNRQINVPVDVQNFLNREDFIYSCIELSPQIALGTGAYMDIYIISHFLLSDIKNNVVYAGDTHVKYYIEILTKLGFELIFSYKSIPTVHKNIMFPEQENIQHNDQCVPIGNTKLPLFS